jgi:hypothetical protein
MIKDGKCSSTYLEQAKNRVHNLEERAAEINGAGEH